MINKTTYLSNFDILVNYFS